MKMGIMRDIQEMAALADEQTDQQNLIYDKSI